MTMENQQVTENAQIVTTEQGNSGTIAVRSTQEILREQFGDLSGMTQDQRVALLTRYTKIASDPDYDLSEILKKDFQIVDALFHMVTLENDKGEKTLAPRCVFITPNDETIACVSDSAMRFIQTLQFTLEFPLEKPVTLNVSEVKTRKGFRTFNFRVVG